ncbi:GNAT family N-acetyltransferase [Vibrio rumoiensis]|uniref:GNAT family N-acetyltransferase n=1 Tax=Vibrio rumoiensis TaxID=76258 RepID=A0ABW7IXR3_9VIBR|nr:GNAT family N-acetyltransferase [Vibrio rumoiensis]
MAPFKHDKQKQRYEVEVAPGYWAHLDYLDHNGALTITHTFVPDELRGQGCGKILMETVLTDVDAQNLNVRPVCSYAVVYLERHAQWQHLLAK